MKTNVTGRQAYVEALKRTAYLFGDRDDLIWLRRGIAALYKGRPDADLFDYRVQAIVSQILSLEMDSQEGRDVPLYRNQVCEETEWYLQHPEIHVPFLTRFLLFRILEGERVPLQREIADWPMTSLSGPDHKQSIIPPIIRGVLPLVFFWALYEGITDSKTFQSIANKLDLPVTIDRGFVWLVVVILALWAIEAIRRVIGETGALYSSGTNLLGHRLPILARELQRICKEIESQGYDGSTIATRLASLQERGLVVNSMVYALLRLPPIPGKTKFRAEWEAAQHPQPERIEVPDH